MKKAVVFYQSKTGTTKGYAKEIEEYLRKKQIEARSFHVNEYSDELTEDIDYVLLGCWTKGLMVILQKPDNEWTDFVKSINLPDSSRVALFATYKIRTGSMFRNMAKPLKNDHNNIIPKLKSKDGKLSETDCAVLDEFIGAA